MNEKNLSLKTCPRCGGRAEKEFNVVGRGQTLGTKRDESFRFDGKVKCVDCGFNVGVRSDYKVGESENPGIPFVSAEEFIIKIWQGLSREAAE